MKKIFVLLAISCAIFLNACNKQETQAPVSAVPQNNVAQENNVAQPQPAQPAETGTLADTFTSVKDAMSKMIPLKCQITDKDGTNMTMYIKNGLMRGEIASGAPTGTSMTEIIKDNKAYIWSANSNQGMIADFTKIKSGAPSSPQSVNSSEDITNEVDQQIQNCAKADIADSMFDVPANIKFMQLPQ